MYVFKENLLLPAFQATYPIEGKIMGHFSPLSYRE